MSSLAPARVNPSCADEVCVRVKLEVKRQRTSSRSPSNSPAVESEDDNLKSSAPKQKPRGAAARSQREKEIREKERERAEAANRRKGRAERRKGEGTATLRVSTRKSNTTIDSEVPEATPTEEPAMVASASESVPPDTPTIDHKPAPARKGGRPQKRQSRLGRNQYTRDAPTPVTNGASPAADDTPNSPQVSSANGAGNGHDSSDGAVGKQTKPKNSRLQKMSWHEIRRPAGVMQEYIRKRQFETGPERSGPTTAVQSPGPTVNGQSAQEESKGEEDELDTFKKLSTQQMMDHLSRDLSRWHEIITEQGEK